VLGVDPGLTRCGLGVVEGPVAAPIHVSHDCVRTPADAPIEQRLRDLHAAVAATIDRFRPDVVAVERVLFSRNVRTAMATGQAAGVILFAGAQAGLPVVQLTPTDVKASVTGDGAADKDGVTRMVVAQLGLATTPRPADAADALAVALAALARHRLGRAGADLPAATTSAGGATSWEDLLDQRGLTVAGGTADRDARRRVQP
jgi:crossover junction endodeoxyribonuclease RuvC